jgi:bla regulator protein BlaR1
MPPKSLKRKKTYVGNPAFLILLLAFVALAIMEYKPSLQIQEGDSELAEYFQGYQAAFVLQDLQGGAFLRHDPARAAQRLPPQSTFKIPNALIALDTGVADGPGFALKWDGVQRSWPGWNRDQTLATAIQYSVVWYFQEIARRIGPERMQLYLKSLEYGNADTSGGIDTFWLGSSLTISAEEQVRFLRGLVEEKLPLSARAMEQVKTMLEVGRNDKAVLYGKTGTEVSEGKATLGWFVGWLERGSRTYVFATNLAAAEGADGKKARAVTEDILRGKKLW